MAKKKLTEGEWSRVFEIRCRCKRGERVSEADMDLCTRAWEEDGARYGAMADKVFEATRPFGSKP